ncbi:hypothetical protein L207DRAFT_430738 [Hyaloscypha variabilis F]|uniref:Acetylserotonin methytransferase-like protein n=1 Tax=Hyaloscypha variabilis (strain UAMH 11265 / GT02V1 / F) TaxID=1149755 RepID=A0A2J6RHV9_HYAVF|nr:hypothetical protein L207DRAFT_430738 [Hyaloscypha variabilis F]
MSDKPVSDKPRNVGLSLFPPEPKKTTNPSRRPSTRRHPAVSPQSPPDSGRQTPQSSPPKGRQTPQSGRETPQQGRRTPAAERVSPIAASPQAEGLSIPRSHTSFSEAPTLVRRDSNASNAEPTNSTTTTAFPREEPVIRSIFPTYHPEIPLEHQPYFPTQTSPAHIPKTVINRRQYSPSVVSGRSAAGLQSPLAIGAAAGRFPRGVQDETIMEPSTNEEMKELWKVVNGWRVSSSEGRSFCLKMTSDAEEPVHTLSSASQPFYTLRLIPTSTSAQMTMTRLDPNKPIKENGSPKLPSSSKPNTGTEVMSTTLEEEARRLPPNDGLVALLYPRAASNMAIDLINRANRSDAEQVLAAAERECGRLVWDEDSRKYYLVHPALSTPFVISITSSPAWSRVEYTLEHSELPRNIVRLVRDGAGSGYLEVDTGVAAKIDCFYVVDVAICAIMLVAIAEEKTKNVERFDAPPSVGPASPMSLKFPKMPKKAKKADRKSVTMEEFEMDLESQNSVSLKKEKVKVKKQKEGDEKVPGFFGLCWMLVKCFFWVIGMFFKALWKCMVLFGKGITYCCRSHK